MKIFLRQHQEGPFYTGKDGAGRWSTDQSQAREFADCSEAETFCAEQGFTNMEILVKYGLNSEAVITVKLPPEK